MTKKDNKPFKEYRTLEDVITACGGEPVWNAAMDAARDILVVCAKNGAAERSEFPDWGGKAGLITYGDFSADINDRVIREAELQIEPLEYENGECEKEGKFQSRDNRRDWLLGVISEESQRDNKRGFMLSALVVYGPRVKTIQGMPGPQFFNLARGKSEGDFLEDIRYEIPENIESARFFWHRQCEKIFTHPDYAKKKK